MTTTITLTARQGTPVVRLLQRDSPIPPGLQPSLWRWTHINNNSTDVLYSGTDRTLVAPELKCYFIRPSVHAGKYELQYQLEGAWVTALSVRLQVTQTWDTFFLREAQQMTLPDGLSNWTVVESDRAIAEREGLVQLNETLLRLDTVLRISRHDMPLDPSLWGGLKPAQALILLRNDAKFSTNATLLVLRDNSTMAMSVVQKNGPPLDWMPNEPRKPYESWAEVLAALTSIYENDSDSTLASQQSLYADYTDRAYRYAQASTPLVERSGLYIGYQSLIRPVDYVAEVHRIDTDAFVLYEFANSLARTELDQIAHMIDVRALGDGVHSLSTKNGKTAVTMLELERGSPSGVVLAAERTRYLARQDSRIAWYLCPLRVTGAVESIEEAESFERINRAPRRLMRLRYFLDALLKITRTPVRPVNGNGELLSFTVAQLEELFSEQPQQEVVFALLAFEEPLDGSEIPPWYVTNDQNLPPQEGVQPFANVIDALLGMATEESVQPFGIEDQLPDDLARLFAGGKFSADLLSQPQTLDNQDIVRVPGDPVPYSRWLTPTAPSRLLLHVFFVSLLSAPKTPIPAPPIRVHQLLLDFPGSAILDRSNAEPANMQLVLERMREQCDNVSEANIRENRTDYEWVLPAARNRQRAYRFVKEALLPWIRNKRSGEWPALIRLADLKDFRIRRVRHSSDGFWFSGTEAVPLLPGQYEGQILFQDDDLLDLEWLRQVYYEGTPNGSLEDMVRAIVDNDNNRRLAYWLFTTLQPSNQPLQKFIYVKDLREWLLVDPELTATDSVRLPLDLLLGRYQFILRSTEDQFPMYYYQMPLYRWRRHLLAVFSARVNQLGNSLRRGTVADVEAALRSDPNSLARFFEVPMPTTIEDQDYVENAETLVELIEEDEEKQLRVRVGFVAARRRAERNLLRTQQRALLARVEAAISDPERVAPDGLVVLAKPKMNLSELVGALISLVTSSSGLSEDAVLQYQSALLSFSSVASRLDGYLEAVAERQEKLESVVFVDSLLRSMRLQADAADKAKRFREAYLRVPINLREQLTREMILLYESNSRALLEAVTALTQTYRTLMQSISRAPDEPLTWALLAQGTEIQLKTKRPLVLDWKLEQWQLIERSLTQQVARAEQFYQNILAPLLERIRRAQAKALADLAEDARRIGSLIRESVSLRIFDEWLSDERDVLVALPELTEQYKAIHNLRNQAKNAIKTVRRIEEKSKRLSDAYNEKIADLITQTQVVGFDPYRFDQNTAVNFMNATQRRLEAIPVPRLQNDREFLVKTQERVTKLWRKAGDIRNVINQMVRDYRANITRQQEEESRRVQEQLERARALATAADRELRERERILRDQQQTEEERRRREAEQLALQQLLEQNRKKREEADARQRAERERRQKENEEFESFLSRFAMLRASENIPTGSTPPALPTIRASESIPVETTPPALPTITMTVAPQRVSTEDIITGATQLLAQAQSTNPTAEKQLEVFWAIIRAHRTIFGFEKPYDLNDNYYRKYVQGSEKPSESDLITITDRQTSPILRMWKDSQKLTERIRDSNYDRLFFPIEVLNEIRQDAQRIRTLARRSLHALASLEAPFASEDGLFAQMYRRDYLATGQPAPRWLRWLIGTIENRSDVASIDIESDNPYAKLSKLYSDCYRLVTSDLLPGRQISMLTIVDKLINNIMEDLVSVPGYDQCIAIKLPASLERLFGDILSNTGITTLYARCSEATQAAFRDLNLRCQSSLFEPVCSRLSEITKKIQTELLEIYQPARTAASSFNATASLAILIQQQRQWSGGSDDSRGLTIALARWLSSISQTQLLKDDANLFSSEGVLTGRRRKEFGNPIYDTRRIAKLATYGIAEKLNVLQDFVQSAQIPQNTFRRTDLVQSVENAWLENTLGKDQNADSNERKTCLAQLYHDARISTLYGVRYTTSLERVETLIGALRFQVEKSLLCNNRELAGALFETYWPVSLATEEESRSEKAVDPKFIVNILVNEMWLNQMITSQVSSNVSRAIDQNPYRRAFFELLSLMRQWQDLKNTGAGTKAPKWTLSSSVDQRELPTTVEDLWKRLSPMDSDSQRLNVESAKFQNDLVEMLLADNTLRLALDSNNPLLEKARSILRDEGESARATINEAFTPGGDADARRRFERDIDVPRIMWPLLLSYRLMRCMWNFVQARLQSTGDTIPTAELVLLHAKQLHKLALKILYTKFIVPPERSLYLPTPLVTQPEQLTFDYFSPEAIQAALFASPLALSLSLHPLNMSTGEYVTLCSSELFCDGAPTTEIARSLIGTRNLLLVQESLTNDNTEPNLDETGKFALSRRYAPESPLAFSGRLQERPNIRHNGDVSSLRPNPELTARYTHLFVRVATDRWVEISLYATKQFRTSLDLMNFDRKSIYFYEPLLPLTAYKNDGLPTGLARVEEIGESVSVTQSTTEQLAAFIAQPGRYLLTEDDLYSSWLKRYYQLSIEPANQRTAVPAQLSLETIAQQRRAQLSAIQQQIQQLAESYRQDFVGLREEILQLVSEHIADLSWPTGAATPTAPDSFEKKWSETFDLDFTNKIPLLVEQERMAGFSSTQAIETALKELKSRAALRVRDTHVWLDAYKLHYQQNMFEKRRLAYERARQVLTDFVI